MKPLASSEFRIGERMPGTNWVVRGVLGSGGMGVVLDVEKEASGLRMAMKVVRPAFARSAEFLAQFSDEVRVLARLRHPNIVEVTDCDTLADGTPYIMMERLQGRTLREAVSDPQIRLTAENIWAVVGPLCRALHCGHTADPPIVHRDVKPGNVFLDDRKHFTSRVKLIDFGISAVLDGKRASGAPMGTASYMAPEACRGEAPTPQVDIYALGVLLYEVLTRTRPWDVDVRSADAVMDAHLNREPIAASRRVGWIPASVDDCLLQALAKDPDKRQRSALEFFEQLGQLPFVDDGSGNHHTEGVTVPTPETLAHGRGGAHARGPREAPSSLARGEPASVEIPVVTDSGSAGRRGDAAIAGPVAGSSREAAERSVFEDSSARPDDGTQTPMSSASAPPKTPVRPRARSWSWRAAWLAGAGMIVGVAAAAPGWRSMHAAGALGVPDHAAAGPAAGSSGLTRAPHDERDRADNPAGEHVEGPPPAPPPRAAELAHAPDPPFGQAPEVSVLRPLGGERIAAPKPDRAKALRPLTDEDLLYVPGSRR